ncbi:hypothetical protein TNCV_212581 [Trichonephila clavipes]|nr:hypothetical protein TNCV_212581 [Trichonephila clavipes]
MNLNQQSWFLSGTVHNYSPQLALIRSHAIFISRRFVFCLRKKNGEVGYGVEEVVGLARQTNLKVDSDDVQEQLDSHNY